MPFPTFKDATYWREQVKVIQRRFTEKSKAKNEGQLNRFNVSTAVQIELNSR